MLALMRTTKAAVTALAAVLLLAGCATAAPTENPTPTETTPSFLDEMRSTDAFFGFEDAQLEDIGQSICAALDDGSGFDDLVDTLAMNDYTEEQASTIIFASAREYCPEHER